MVEIAIIAARPADLDRIARDMRPADVAEAYAMSGLSPRSALEYSAAVSSETWAGTVDGDAVCVFGLGIGSLYGLGRPWLMATPQLEQHAMAFLRRNRAMVERWQAETTLLENWVDARHRVSKRWLGWLGFTLDAPAPFGPEEMPFHRFERRAA
jgi:hypothetical protein